jgi:hypothetical protein
MAHFIELPPIVVYDNACNVVSSLGLRARWVLEKVRFVVDRCHFFNHKYGQYFDANEVPSVDKFGFSSAEAINSSLALGKGTLSFLSGDNYVCFLTARAVYLNVAAHAREKIGRSDLEDEPLAAHFRRMLLTQSAWR